MITVETYEVLIDKLKGRALCLRAVIAEKTQELQRIERILALEKP